MNLKIISAVVILILLLSAFRVVQAADYFPPPDSEGGWRTLKEAAQIRESAGMDLHRLEQAFDFTQRCTQNGGLLVVRHGYLVFEKYFGRAHRNANPDMASTGKAYTSIACGIMLHEFRDKIPGGLDTKVFTEKYLPEAFPLDEPLSMDVRGRNLIEGIPKTITMTDEEVREALSDSVSTIINAVRVALERTPPELSADIVERGIVLTGGGALLKNLDKRLMIETGLPVVIADDPLSSVVLGTGKMLSDIELLKRVKWDNSLMTGN